MEAPTMAISHSTTFLPLSPSHSSSAPPQQPPRPFTSYQTSPHPSTSRQTITTPAPPCHRVADPTWSKSPLTLPPVLLLLPTITTALTLPPTSHQTISTPPQSTTTSPAPPGANSIITSPPRAKTALTGPISDLFLLPLATSSITPPPAALAPPWVKRCRYQNASGRGGRNSREVLGGGIAVFPDL